jgi:hypothetical protein
MSQGKGIVPLAVAGVVVVVAASGVAGEVATRDRLGVRSSSMAPLSHRLDPEAMPGLLASRARAVLPVEVSSQPVRFFAGDARFKQVPVGGLSRAAYMYSDFGSTDQHRWRLYVAKTSDTVIGDPEKAGSCAQTLAQGTALACEITEDATGSGTLMYVTATVYDSQTSGYHVVDTRTITPDQLPDVRLERHVEVIHADGSETSVTETLLAPVSLSVDLFATSVADAIALASDPALQLPAD